MTHQLDPRSPPGLLSIAEVIARARPEDVAELTATRGVFDRDQIATDIAVAAECVFCAVSRQGRPAAIFGWHRMTPAVIGLFAFGTDEWPSVVRDMTKHIRRTIIPAFPSIGVHRAECRALASREDVKRWLTGNLGMRPEAVLSEFGVRREDFILYAWTAAGEASSDHDGEHPGERQVQACNA